jgi:gluconate 2-dehydrogenase alpha chain
LITPSVGGETTMATMLKEVDAVCIGVGFTGSILARELTKAGLKVVGLERGADRSTREDFTLPSVRDDLKYAVRQELFQDTQTETVTLRHSPSETALPLRRLGSFLPGTGVGGAGAHWNGVTWRLLPSDHNLRSHLQNRYGRDAIPAEMTIEDYPVSYDELEPYYDRFEKLCGISGKAGNLRGQIVAGGNVFEGARQNEYPNRPLVQTMAGSLMEKAAKDLGYHPFPAPSANMSGVYTNPEGVTLGACEYCGHCERFGCEANAKASPQACILPVLLPDPKFELRTYAYVKELVYDKQAKKVKAVRYVDTRSGEEFEQPAGLVIMGAYVFNNVLLMLTAGIGEPYDHTTGKGAVGRNYCY